VKQVRAIKQLLALAKGVVDVFKLSARSFSGMPFLLSTASPMKLLHLLLPVAYPRLAAFLQECDRASGFEVHTRLASHWFG
jgi:hypothetical protein